MHSSKSGVLLKLECIVYVPHGAFTVHSSDMTWPLMTACAVGGKSHFLRGHPSHYTISESRPCISRNHILIWPRMTLHLCSWLPPAIFHHLYRHFFQFMHITPAPLLGTKGPDFSITPNCSLAAQLFHSLVAPSPLSSVPPSPSQFLDHACTASSE